ncbi:MAG TPA: hypothetical protein VH560_04445 [Polyangia bacterium]|nr:hypothetical protein [Polyangia bacterium]
MKTWSVVTPACVHDTNGPFWSPVLSFQVMCTVGAAHPPLPAAPLPAPPLEPAVIIMIDPPPPASPP